MLGEDAAMRMIKIYLALIFTAGVLVPATARAAADVDLLLVLAADVSRSIDDTKFQFQRDGYAAAVTNSRVLARSGPAVPGASACASSNGQASASTW